MNIAAIIASHWHTAKTFIERSIAFSDDALHVMLGVVLLLIVALVTRRSISRWLPWLIVLALELANEAVDLWVERWPVPAEQYGEGMKDVLLTMVLPTLLLMVARLLPGLFRSR